MFGHISRRHAVPALTLGAAGVVLLAVPGAGAATACATVEGSYVEHAVGGPSCSSPVGLCIAGTYSGDIRGDFAGSATSIITTADTPVTTVAMFTSTSTISATTAGRTGVLQVRNAGAFTGNPDASIVDLQTIVGGTGALTGASGSLRASGTFTASAGGRSRWVGVLCLPSR